ncbi:hypothetical protein ElyMa_001840500 [Elysia marginata]|uniref:Uncharacterized protein n=1 Tax=Elysia marginata TaxID=1093978 RepID=A0AAV4EJN3_9GAST|nr:hypothetical protein ElyMa_001840500 [Elysia marginata]
MCVNSLSQGLNFDLPKAGLELRTSRSESRASTTTPPRHTNHLRLLNCTCLFKIDTFVSIGAPQTSAVGSTAQQTKEGTQQELCLHQSPEENFFDMRKLSSADIQVNLQILSHQDCMQRGHSSQPASLVTSRLHAAR